MIVAVVLADSSTIIQLLDSFVVAGLQHHGGNGTNGGRVPAGVCKALAGKVSSVLSQKEVRKEERLIHVQYHTRILVYRFQFRFQLSLPVLIYEGVMFSWMSSLGVCFSRIRHIDTCTLCNQGEYSLRADPIP
jgi:hypothetical protein